VEGADHFLSIILGGTPAKPAVPTLRVVKDSEGDSLVALYVGSRHVGCLPRTVDRELLSTLQACDHYGAVTRARGKLIARWDAPGRVMVKVSLAEPGQLLTKPQDSPPNMSPETHRAWAEAMPQSLSLSQPGWLGSAAQEASRGQAPGHADTVWRST
jgi:hypothetical protein